ncbi:MAG: DUF5131 family protein [Promethearchaeota archaeon]
MESEEQLRELYLAETNEKNAIWRGRETKKYIKWKRKRLLAKLMVNPIDIDFSIDGTIYKIFKREKRTTIRPLKQKWKDVLKEFRLNTNGIIPLHLYWKKRDEYGFRFLITKLLKIEPYNLNEMTEKDANIDGFGNKDKLLEFLLGIYGDDYSNDEFVKIWWDTNWDRYPIDPVKTSIDWYDKLGQELYTINPLVIHKPNTDWKNCPFLCVYCYARGMYIWQADSFQEGFYEGRLIGLKYAKDNVFFESTTDLFHNSIPLDLIKLFVELAHKYNSKNRCRLHYLTKNPARYKETLNFFTEDYDWLGTTIESNTYKYQGKKHISFAPTPEERLDILSEIDFPRLFISLEPVLEFNKILVKKIIETGAKFVIIGANSNRLTINKLNEPTKKDVEDLTKELERNKIQVIRKDNLTRITNKEV